MHGFYIWGSVGAVAALMLVESVLLLRRHRAALSRSRP
jgi:heme exporter protein CcmD